jgi:hypothetical protein
MLSFVILILSDVLLYPANEYRTLRVLLSVANLCFLVLNNKFNIVAIVIVDFSSYLNDGFLYEKIRQLDLQELNLIMNFSIVCSISFIVLS